MGAGSVPHWQDGEIRSLPSVLLSPRIKVQFSCEKGGNVHIFSLIQEGTMLAFRGPGWGLLGELMCRCWRHLAEPLVSDAHGPSIASLAHSSPCTSVPVSDERTRSFLDTPDNSSHILHKGRGRSSAPSVKELSALYLSQTAAAAAHTGSSTELVSTTHHCRHPAPSQITSGIRTMSCPSKWL